MTSTQRVEVLLPTATLPRRLAAMLYDCLLLAAVWWCIGLLAVGLAGGAEVRPPHNRWLTAALATASYLYFVWPWIRSGQTLGMKTWRLIVRGHGGERLSWPQASTRFFAAILAWLPCGLGYWWSVLDADRLAWHDRLSRTRLLVLPEQDR